MIRYYKIYKKLLELNFLTLLAYRSNFINSMISSLGWGAFSFFSMYLLTLKVNSIYGWSRYELLLLAAVYNIVIGTFHIFFSRNFERFSTVIHYGLLDGILLKPVDSQFLLSFWLFNYTGVFRVLLGIGFTFYILQSLIKIQFTFVALVWFLILMIVGIVTLYSVWFIISTIIIWHTRLSNLVALLYQLNNLTRYPHEFFKGVHVSVFLIVFPLTLVVAVPIRTFLFKSSVIEIGQLFFVSVILLFVSRVFWRFALRFYTSASG